LSPPWRYVGLTPAANLALVQLFIWEMLPRKTFGEALDHNRLNNV
jgi:hypothetical protein